VTDPRIFYYAAGNDEPSWGIGMLYTHVRLLRRNGLNAFLLHDRSPFRITWMESEEPAVYRDDGSFVPAPEDLIVVPEILAARPFARECAARKVMFVQGSSLIAKGLFARDLNQPRSFRDLGYTAAIAVMPHIQEILDRFFDIASTVIPPCIAPYFFARVDGSPSRKKQVVLYPKMDGEDYPILRDVLTRRLPVGWEIVELRGLSHRETAAALRESAFHINVNCQESFNATVPEAMASGAIVICYDGFGGRDYLCDGVNAFVFPNHHVFPLLDRALDLIVRHDELEPALEEIRHNGFRTARKYTEESTERQLLNFYAELMRPT
jgi:glycosyltransferase involved in cell wall biosynthesis